jgi:hypothetical protein
MRLRQTTEEIVRENLPPAAIELVRLSKAQLVALAVYLGARVNPDSADDLDKGVWSACMEMKTIRRIVPGRLPKAITDICSWKKSVYNYEVNP